MTIAPQGNSASQGRVPGFPVLNGLVLLAVLLQSVGLFVLVVAETGPGEAIGQQHSLVGAHVPVAILVMALSAYLTAAQPEPTQCSR